MGKSRLYTPCNDDVGSVLKVEVVVIDASRGVKREAGHTFSVSTTRVKVRLRRLVRHLLVSGYLRSTLGRLYLMCDCISRGNQIILEGFC